ncbi:MAG: T9SS type A sorting domain-containing protein [Bacteroidetes bacterium]|nr:T9SS type A sorting domain-containing protein [Bacteroidota bacterium]
MKRIFFLILFFVGNALLMKGQYTKLFDFNGTTNGGQPSGSLISDGTFLYGMNYQGGTNSYGNIFKIKLDGTAYDTLMNFNFFINGAQPVGDLYYDGTFLYGMTSTGGTYGKGTIFKILTDGTGYMKLLDFAGASNGNEPDGSLISDGTFLYGMTKRGGINNDGTIFKILPDGTGYLKLLDFSLSTTGSFPWGTFTYDGNYLYGMTQYGGINNDGTIFKILPDGTGYARLLDFLGTSNGKYPEGSLASDGTFLYGMTTQGGVNTDGTIFKIMPDGTGYVKLLDFAGATNGSSPYGSLICNGSFLYGMTAGGGVSAWGTLFKIRNDGTSYTKYLDFFGAATGAGPGGSLLVIGSYLYGMTTVGGVYSHGTIFRYQFMPLGINENNSLASLSLFPNPSSGIFTLYSNTTNGEISVCNMLGQSIFESTINDLQSTIDLTGQPNGIYFVMLKTDEKIFSQKIVINK